MIRIGALVQVCLGTLLSVACVTEDVTVGPPQSSPAALAEITVEECVVDQGATQPTPATGEAFTTIETGKLMVGSDTAHPPFSNMQDGVAAGFDVDLIAEVADRLGGLEVEVVTARFDGILQALASDEFDAVISAVTIGEESKATVDFTDAYLSADQSLAIRTTDAGAINGLEDLEGKVVGVQAGRTGEDCARDAVKERYGAAEVRSYDTVVDAFNDLAAGQADAVLSDLPTSKQIIEDLTGFALAQVIRTQEEFGIAVSKRNPDLREAINRALVEIREDGTYARLFEEWFRAKPPAG